MRDETALSSERIARAKCATCEQFVTVLSLTLTEPSALA